MPSYSVTLVTKGNGFPAGTVTVLSAPNEASAREQVSWVLDEDREKIGKLAQITRGPALRSAGLRS